MADIILAGILLIVIAIATAYIIKAKKNGVKCIGCPAAGQCAAKKGCSLECSCGCSSDIKAVNQKLTIS